MGKAAMIDFLDIFAFIVFAVLGATVVVTVVVLGSLPAAIARKRGHPQAAAINIASWLGVATLGLLWPLALIWAFLRPSSIPLTAPDSRSKDDVDSTTLKARVDSLEGALRE